MPKKVLWGVAMLGSSAMLDFFPSFFFTIYYPKGKGPSNTAQALMGQGSFDLSCILIEKYELVRMSINMNIIYPMVPLRQI